MLDMSTICIIAVRSRGYSEITVPALVRPDVLPPVADLTGKEQLLVLQQHITANFAGFAAVADDIAEKFPNVRSFDSLFVLEKLYSAYDGLVEDADRGLTIFSRAADIRFSTSRARLCERMRNTIRDHAGYTKSWEPCGMEVVLGIF